MQVNQPGFYSIDVEDYYHILDVKGTPSLKSWDLIPSRVEKGLYAHFDLLDSCQAKATCFFLGYIARRFPALVKEALKRGHEVASHGMYHSVVARQGKERFIQDASSSKKLLEDISGSEVLGWRAAGFSFDKSCPWYFESLAQCDYKYDSSLLPNRRKHQIVPGIRDAIFEIDTTHGKLFEIPISVARLACLKISMFGGCYLRFFPRSLISVKADEVLRTRPLLIYIHPRELDMEHPKIEMNPLRRFKSYVNLESVEAKLRELLSKTKYIRISDYIQSYEMVHKSQQ
ncbi:MAG: polysaccharide deacetylase family protein [Candidatus Cloacimonetes bacterium]|nr:polysaccharide deacetylase family protein [Candidatus Cloacimonadota bacterium]